MLRIAKGNMYSFITHTWNPIKGRCSHDCEYCYMKRFPQKELRLDEKDLDTVLGTGNFIFAGSSTDMFAADVPREWIAGVLAMALIGNGNRYLYQSKNPARFFDFVPALSYATLGTTIETNRDCKLSKAPSVDDRATAMQELAIWGFDTMVTIEPIVDFDIVQMVGLVKRCKPKWVNIGANSKGHNLPEPTPYKTRVLIQMLKAFTTVNIKPNLRRIYAGE